MKPRHRYLLAHPSMEERAKEHAATLAARDEHDLITYEVALRDDCPPEQMFVLYYLPKPTWFLDAVLVDEGDDAR